MSSKTWHFANPKIITSPPLHSAAPTTLSLSVQPSTPCACDFHEGSVMVTVSVSPYSNVGRGWAGLCAYIPRIGPFLSSRLVLNVQPQSQIPTEIAHSSTLVVHISPEYELNLILPTCHALLNVSCPCVHQSLHPLHHARLGCSSPSRSKPRSRRKRRYLCHA